MRALLLLASLVAFSCEVPDPDTDEPTGGGTAGGTSGGGSAGTFTPRFSWFSLVPGVQPTVTVTSTCVTKNGSTVVNTTTNTQPSSAPAAMSALSTLNVPAQAMNGQGSITGTFTVTPSANTVTMRFQANGTATATPMTAGDVSCSMVVNAGVELCPTGSGTFPTTVKIRASGTEANVSTESNSLITASVSTGNFSLLLDAVGAVRTLPKDVSKPLSLSSTNCPIISMREHLTLHPTVGAGTMPVTHTLTTDLTTVFEITSP